MTHYGVGQEIIDTLQVEKEMKETCVSQVPFWVFDNTFGTVLVVRWNITPYKCTVGNMEIFSCCRLRDSQPNFVTRNNKMLP